MSMAPVFIMWRLSFSGGDASKCGVISIRDDHVFAARP